MDENSLPTEFAPAERASQQDLHRHHGALSSLPILRKLLDAMPNPVLVLNGFRQAVFYNQALMRSLDLPEGSTVLGKRPGELLRCVNATAPGGCGTTRFCRVCGGVKATLEALDGRAAVEEYRIATLNPAEARDLRVWATPFQHEGEDFVIFAIMDISHEKRREALERIFFHDVLNTAGAVHGVAEFIGQAKGDELLACKSLLLSASSKLIEEIQSQRDLNSAERGDLATKTMPVSPAQFLKDLAALYHNHEVAKDRTVKLAAGPGDPVLTTDRTLLSRVVGNMLKNALEASSPGAAVTLGARADGDGVVFSVHNPAVMPEKVRLQVFQRSFSTKGGSGRGLGTYSMKLLGERYLKGRVWFESSEGAGTTFHLRIPIKTA